MSTDGQFSELVSQVRKLFSETYYAHAALSQEIITQEDEDTLAKLDHLEVVDNLKDLIQVLLNDKNKLVNSDLGDIVKTNQAFEKMLQTLEGQCRDHIRIEEQLKIHIDEWQQQVEELKADKIPDYSQFDDKIRELKWKLDEMTKEKKQMSEQNQQYKEKLAMQKIKNLSMKQKLSSEKKKLQDMIDQYTQLKVKLEISSSSRQKTDSPKPSRRLRNISKIGGKLKLQASRRLQSVELADGKGL